jgi:PKD repeat protein
MEGGPTPVSIRWDFGDGEVANTTNPQHTFDIPGSYIVTLNVTYRQEIFRESMKQIVVKAHW